MFKVRKVILKVSKIFLILIPNLSKHMLKIRKIIPKISKIFLIPPLHRKNVTIFMNGLACVIFYFLRPPCWQQIRAYNLRDVKRDRTLVRSSKHSVRLLYAVPKFAIFLDRTVPIYLN